MSVKLISWALEQQTGSSTRKLVLLALADHANGHTGECFPNIARIADETELGYRTVQRALVDLEAAGFIARDRQRRPDGALGSYFYTFPPPADLAGSPPDTVAGSPPAALAGVREEPEEVQPEGPPVSPPGPMGQILARSAARHISMVAEAWQAHSPPLISHRDTYLADPKTQTAIKRALRVYPVEVVTEAVTNYAAVLAGDEFRWDYRWTIIDFLKRGLDRFVPEALPLENFRIRNGGPPQKFGRRDVSAREMMELADRLEAEQETERRELEPG